MKIKYFLMAAVVALMTACGTASKVPLTGRTHRISISDAQLLASVIRNIQSLWHQQNVLLMQRIQLWCSV